MSSPNISRNQNSAQRRSGSYSSWRVGEKKGSQIISHSSSGSEGSYHFTKPELPKNKSYSTLPHYFKPAALAPASESNNNTNNNNTGGVENTATWLASTSSSSIMKRDKSVENIYNNNNPSSSGGVSRAEPSPSAPITLSRLLQKKEPPSPSPSPSPFYSLDHDNTFLNPHNNSNFISTSPSSSALRRENTVGTFVPKSPTISRRDMSLPITSSSGASSTSSSTSPSTNVSPHNLSTFTPIISSEQSPSARPRKRDDVDRLMTKVWGDAYKEGELFVQGMEYPYILFPLSFVLRTSEVW